MWGSMALATEIWARQGLAQVTLRSFESDPNPDLTKPRPVLQGLGFFGFGSGSLRVNWVTETHWVVTTSQVFVVSIWGIKKEDRLSMEEGCYTTTFGPDWIISQSIGSLPSSLVSSRPRAAPISSFLTKPWELHSPTQRDVPVDWMASQPQT